MKFEETLFFNHLENSVLRKTETVVVSKIALQTLLAHTKKNERRAEKPRVYLDLDGVMADFDGHCLRTFGGLPHEFTDNELWRLIGNEPSFFADMSPCQGAIDFFDIIHDMQPIILTACPRSNYELVAKQKRKWARQHLAEDIQVLPVMGGVNKHLFMHKAGDILIDDYEKNCLPWHRDGGVAIQHTSFSRTLELLLANY